MSDADRDDALARLGDEVERLLAAGEEPDPPTLAARFGVDLEDAEACIASLRAIGDVLFSDLDVDVPLPPPALPDDYEIIAEIGRGGMGVVYRARQRSLDREVAVKVVRPAALGYEATVRRFRREARSLARLRHPGIVSVHEVGMAGDAVWFAMDLVEGESLADLLRVGALPAAEAVRIVAQVASAVAYTHGRGIIHRDLKPANVLLDRDGNAWVVDFGLAREEGMSLDATGTGHLLGTPAYMAPEQARGDADAVGERTDVYALGALLHECLAGRPLFERQSLPDLVHAVLHHDPEPLRKVAPHAPRELETIVLRATAKRPDRRYATARAMLADLRAYEEGVPIRARRPGSAYALGRLVRRRWRAFAGIAVTAGLAVAILLLFVVPRIGRTPRTMLATAEDLLGQGEPRAARMLLEDAVERHGADATGGLAIRLHGALATARAGVVRGLLMRGALDEAEDLATRVLADADRVLGPRTDWSGLDRLLWDRARVAGARGEVRDLHQRVSEMEARLSSARRPAEGPPDLTREIFEPNRWILGPLGETLDDPPPHRETALSVLVDRAVRGSRERIAEWIVGRGTSGALGVLQDLIRMEGAKAARHWVLLDPLVDALERRVASETEAALAALARDEDASDRVRAVALRFLVLATDLPSVDVFATPPDRYNARYPVWDESQARTLLALWTSTRDAPFADSLRARFDTAVEIGDVGWLLAHTGYGMDEVADWREWWERRRGGDPHGWFAPGLTIPGADVELLLGRLRREGRFGKRFPWHLRLRLLAPAGVHAPRYSPTWSRRPATGVNDERLAAAWRAALDLRDTGRPWVVRIAWFRCAGADPARILWEEVRNLRVGESVVLEGRHEEPPRGWSGAIRVPGFFTPVDQPPPVRTTGSATLALEWGEEGLLLRGTEGRLTRAGAGWSTWSHGGGTGRTIPAGMILALDSMEGYSGSGERHPIANDFPLAVAEPPGTDDRPWSVDDWRVKLAENLAFYADGIEGDPKPELPGFDTGPFATRYHDVGWTLPIIVAKLGLDGSAVADLRRAYPADRGRLSHVLIERRDLDRARLMVGDAILLDGAAGRIPGLDDRSGTGTRLFLGRLLLTTEEPRIREAAAGVLATDDLTPVLSARLERAIEEEGLDVPAALGEKVAGARWRLVRGMLADGALGLAVGVLLWLLAIVTTLRVAWPGRPASRRLGPAGWMVVLGALFLAVEIRWGTLPLLPDEIGALLALVGAAVLARAAGGLAGRIAVAGFAAAIVGAVVARLGGPEEYRTVSGAAIALAIVAIPRLAHRLDDGGRPGRHFPFFTLFFSIPILAAWGLGFGALVTGMEMNVQIEGLPGGLILTALASGALWAILLLRMRAGARAQRLALGGS